MPNQNLDCFRPYIERANELATLFGSVNVTTFHLLIAVVDLAQDDLRSLLPEDFSTDTLIEMHNLGGFSVEHPSLYTQVLAAGLRARGRATGTHDDSIYLLMGIMALPMCLGFQVMQSLQVVANNLQPQLARLVGLTVDKAKHRVVGQPTLVNIETRNEPAQPSVQLVPLTPLRLGGGSVLASIGKDITLLASQGKIDPVIGRDKEISKAMQVLLKRKKNNPVFIGEAGVGKTAIAEGVALALVSRNDIPEKLKGKRIFSLSLNNLTAGTQYRGQFEERFQRLLKEITSHPEIIIFIDELHTVLGAGSSEGGLDAANILKPSLARGEFPCMGATTLDEYRKYIEKDAALERRFHPVLIDEPSEEVTLQILRGLKKKYEDYHKVTYTDAAIIAAVKLTARYVHERNFPDKAIDVLDEAGSREIMIADGDPGIDEKEIIQVVQEWTGVPVMTSDAYRKRLLTLDSELLKFVIGQNPAVEKVSKSLVAIKMGKQPIGSFIFLGPTGVGKTEVARRLAYLLFQNDEAFIKLDMSEYQEKFQVSRLIGAPPGYVGYDEGGLLIEKVRRKPYCVILLDEIEKAHIDIFDILLQVLEDGELTDSQGRKAHFENTVIIMTTNVMPKREKSIGFSNESAQPNADVLHEALLKKGFRLEFINRVDEIVLFEHLSRDDMRKILELRLQEVATTIQVDYNGIKLIFTQEAKDRLLDKGFSVKFGARELKRTIKRLILSPFGQKVTNREFVTNDSVNVIIKANKINFEKIK